MENFFRDNKQVAVSVLALWGILIVLFLGSTNIYRRISKVRGRIAQNEQELVVLENKLQTLNNAQAGSISLLATSVTEALPVNNTSMSLILQIKNLAELNNLALTYISFASGGVSLVGISGAGLDLTLQGNLVDVSQFLQNLESVKPITNIRVISFKRVYGEDVVSVDITLNTFWSELPTEIPPVSKSVAGLTQSEESTLNTVSQFTPLFSLNSIEDQIEFSPKDNPFTLR